jgi:hypothetical protein
MKTNVLSALSLLILVAATGCQDTTAAKAAPSTVQPALTAPHTQPVEAETTEQPVEAETTEQPAAAATTPQPAVIGVGHRLLWWGGDGATPANHGTSAAGPSARPGATAELPADR